MLVHHVTETLEAILLLMMLPSMLLSSIVVVGMLFITVLLMFASPQGRRVGWLES